MAKTDEEIVQELVTLSNSKEVLTKCEPQVMWHAVMNEWQIKRVLEAQRILLEMEE